MERTEAGPAFGSGTICEEQSGGKPPHSKAPAASCRKERPGGGPTVPSPVTLTLKSLGPNPPQFEFLVLLSRLQSNPVKPSQTKK